MSAPFHFDGRSRTSNMTLARDHVPTRASLLDDARRRRLERAEAQRKQAAAECVQRAARQWLARREVLRRSIDYVLHIPLAKSGVSISGDGNAAHEEQSAAGPVVAVEALQRALWCISYIDRYQRILPLTPPWDGAGGADDRQESTQLRRRAVLDKCSAAVAEATRATVAAALAEHCPLPWRVIVASGSSLLWQYCVANAVSRQAVGLPSSSSSGADADVILDALARLAEMVESPSFVEGPRCTTSLASVLLSASRALQQTERCRLAPLLVRLVHVADGNLGATVGSDAAEFTTGADVLWGSLVASVVDDYLPLSGSAVAVLLSLRDSEGTVCCAACNRALIREVVQVAYQRVEVVGETRVHPEDALHSALGRLVRLLPHFTAPVPEAGAAGASIVRKKWLLTIGRLTERLCRTRAFVDEVVYDLHYTPPSQNTRRFLVSYLFSSLGGLRLLNDITGAVPRGQHDYTEADAQLGSDLEIVCGVFAWLLLYFSLDNSPLSRTDTAAILSRLVHSPQLLRQLWQLYMNKCDGLRAVLPPGKVLEGLLEQAATSHAVVCLPTWREPPTELVLAHCPGQGVRRHLFWEPCPPLAIVFFSVLGYYIGVVDMAEEVERATVLSKEELWVLVLALKEIVHRSHLFGVLPHTGSEAVAHLASLLLSKLHVINEAMALVPYPSLWISVVDQGVMQILGHLTPKGWSEMIENMEESRRNTLNQEEEEVAGVERTTNAAITTTTGPQHPSGYDAVFDGSCDWTMQERFTRLLLHAPFVVPFPERAALLMMFLRATSPERVPGMPNELIVRRGRVFEDVFAKFHNRPDAVETMFVRFSAGDGSLEEGHGQGVYREMVVELCKEGFAAEHGLFSVTEDGYLYPNPYSFEVTGDPQHLRKIGFLSNMVGRALRDGILQDAPFTLHFRNSLLGRRNTVNHLKSFDAQLHRQLLSLLTLSDSALEALELTFTYTVTTVGVTREVELIKGGATIAVTRRNCAHYVDLVADFKLNREGAAQVNAYKGGLSCIIFPEWLRLFDSNELLNLFGGDRASKIDIDDWKKHTVYDNDAAAKSKPVRIFWEVVESLTALQQSQLLQFTTSMCRPPLLGFRFLTPPFKVRVVNTLEQDRLPTAGTCFSTLTMPPYSSFKVAREKIIAAIEETATFANS